ncbi:MAG: hypothetical protein MI867_25545 [Pseudomonadales bacterium]|nr:hypothetical protein [Pseudomonadales bacterium]
MKLFKRSKKTTIELKNDINTSNRRNKVTVEAVRKKLAGYQKTEGRACFVTPQEMSYLADGTISFETIAIDPDKTMGFEIPFTAA